MWKEERIRIYKFICPREFTSNPTRQYLVLFLCILISLSHVRQTSTVWHMARIWLVEWDYIQAIASALLAPLPAPLMSLGALQLFGVVFTDVVFSIFIVYRFISAVIRFSGCLLWIKSANYRSIWIRIIILVCSLYLSILIRLLLFMRYQIFSTIVIILYRGIYFHS